MKKKLLKSLKLEFQVCKEILQQNLAWFLLKLNKSPYVTFLARYFIIILGVFTLLLLIILIVILIFIVLSLQEDILDQDSHVNYQNPSEDYYENNNIKCNCQKLPNSDYSNISNLVDTEDYIRTDILEDMFKVEDANLGVAWNRCVWKINKTGEIYNEIIDHAEIREATGECIFFKKDNITSFNYIVQKNYMKELIKEVNEDVNLIETRYLDNVMRAEAQYFRRTGMNKYPIDKYREFYKILTKYNGNYWYVYPNSKETENYKW
jgi:hypothetical protein